MCDMCLPVRKRKPRHIDWLTHPVRSELKFNFPRVVFFPFPLPFIVKPSFTDPILLRSFLLSLNSLLCGSGGESGSLKPSSLSLHSPSSLFVPFFSLCSSHVELCMFFSYIVYFLTFFLILLFIRMCCYIIFFLIKSSNETQFRIVWSLQVSWVLVPVPKINCTQFTSILVSC